MPRGLTNKRPTILVVDDEYAIRILLKTFLESHDYEVHCAEDAEAALELSRHHRPDLIISDIMMPSESGISIVSKIRAFSPGVKVIYLSAWADEAETEIILKHERQEHPECRIVQKPFQLDIFLKTIDDCLRG